MQGLDLGAGGCFVKLMFGELRGKYLVRVSFLLDKQSQGPPGRFLLQLFVQLGCRCWVLCGIVGCIVLGFGFDVIGSWNLGAAGC